MELHQEQANIADQSSERARLRRVLLYRDSVLTQMRFEVSSLTAERDQAIQDHLTLRYRMTSLMSGDPVPIPTPVASTDPISGAVSRPITSDLAMHIRKRPRKAVPSRTHLVPKRVTRSSIPPYPNRLLNLGDRAISIPATISRPLGLLESLISPH